MGKWNVKITAADLAIAFRRVTSGVQNPPKPWADLSHCEITRVDNNVIWAIQDANLDAASFTLTADDSEFEVTVRKIK